MTWRDNAIVNVRIEDNGKSYRIPFQGSHALLVARKLPSGKETLLEIDKPRAMGLIEKARAKL